MDWVGLRWVGSKFFQFAMGWVGLDHSVDKLGWVGLWKMSPRTTLRYGNCTQAIVYN